MILVIPRAQIEAPTAVEIPLIVQIDGLGLEVGSVAEAEDRIPLNDVTRLDVRMERPALGDRCLHTERVHAEVRARLIVVRDPLLGPILIADVQVVRAGAFGSHVVRELRIPVFVVALFRTARAAEDRPAEERALVEVIGPGAVREIMGIAAFPHERKVLLRPVHFGEEIIREDAAVVRRFEVVRLGARGIDIPGLVAFQEAQVSERPFDVEVRHDDAVLRRDLAGQLRLVARFLIALGERNR